MHYFAKIVYLYNFIINKIKIFFSYLLSEYLGKIIVITWCENSNFRRSAHGRFHLDRSTTLDAGQSQQKEPRPPVAGRGCNRSPKLPKDFVKLN